MRRGAGIRWGAGRRGQGAVNQHVRNAEKHVRNTSKKDQPASHAPSLPGRKPGSQASRPAGRQAGRQTDSPAVGGRLISLFGRLA